MYISFPSATSFGKSQVQPLIPIMGALPSELHVTVPYLLSFIMGLIGASGVLGNILLTVFGSLAIGDPVKMAMACVEDNLPILQTFEELSNSLTSLLPLLSELADIIPQDTLLWKLNLLKSGAAYVNSRLHAVKAEVLVLASSFPYLVSAVYYFLFAVQYDYWFDSECRYLTCSCEKCISGKDNLLPSGDEADRLWASLKNCKVRYFKDSGHTLLLVSCHYWSRDKLCCLILEHSVSL
ncbi:hypothetical protein B296_00026577 [Ensete ventricosum]|uniref:Uncharacterized protein n=1 Tax=Ensete ventricosum TaxID=4639 RepID=A0A427AQQ9_ENSVE|nr:hypothetical protein B296_00026577 [Ensete ventricosum]